MSEPPKPTYIHPDGNAKRWHIAVTPVRAGQTVYTRCSRLVRVIATRTGTLPADAQICGQCRRNAAGDAKP